MLVRDRMSRKLITVAPEEPLAEVRKLLDRHKIRQLPVVRGARLVGIITDRDLRGTPAKARIVKDVMTPSPVEVSPDTSVDEAARLLHVRKFGAVPVVEKARLVGILTISDLLEAFVDLSGVEELTYRLVILCSDRKAEAEIRRLVQEKHGEIKWIHVETKRRPAEVHLRLKARRGIDEIVTSLEAAGFDVATIVAPGRKR